MTADIAIALHWMEGHIAELELEAAGHEYAVRAALTVEDQVLFRAEHDAVRVRQEQWREVIRRATRSTRRGYRS